MTRGRTVEPITLVPTHNDRIVRAVTMTETAVHTVSLPEGHFTAIVMSRPNSDTGAIGYVDHDEVEALIALLRNAVEDAKRLDRGEAAIHAAPSLRRN